ncbi:uncharacterized protein LOC135472767 [Liolophura sinensis]|uniref:uncharacterized protein LOC135472767 n=1 Tax=Liolophura sinensis TaxID=3198878 RepID=UPI0031584560
MENCIFPTERALGVQWNTDTDKLGIRAQIKSKPMTRWGLISVISSIYDPLGFVCPFILQGKKIFQNETRLKKGWDELLTPENEKKWSRWIAEILKLEKFKVERCILPGDFGKIVTRELHHFSDASVEAYGAFSYLRSVNGEGRVHCSVLVKKSRLTIKQIQSLVRN